MVAAAQIAFPEQEAAPQGGLAQNAAKDQSDAETRGAPDELTEAMRP